MSSRRECIKALRGACHPGDSVSWVEMDEGKSSEIRLLSEHEGDVFNAERMDRWYP